MFRWDWQRFPLETAVRGRRQGVVGYLTASAKLRSEPATVTRKAIEVEGQPTLQRANIPKASTSAA